MRKHALLIALAFVASFSLHAPAHADSGVAVVISEVYGGGGNSAATWDHDYVELFDRSRSSVDLTGWKLEYSSTSSTTWTATTLRGSIAATHYLLVRLGAGGTTGKPLPTPDITGSTNIARTSGKVRLRNTAGAVVDLIGYGSGVNAYETKPAPGVTKNTESLNRARWGCTDTNANDKDFKLASPIPKTHVDHFYCGAKPVLSPVGNKTVEVSKELTFAVSATDADHDPLRYSAAPLPAGATFTAATRTFDWKPKSADIGDHQVTFTVSDGFAKDSETITITVKPDPLAGRTTTSLTVTQDTRRTIASGQVAPNEAGKIVNVQLFRQERRHYRRLESKQVVLNSESRYTAYFRRPTDGGRCLVHAKFSADAERTASDAEWSGSC